MNGYIDRQRVNKLPDRRSAPPATSPPFLASFLKQLFAFFSGMRVVVISTIANIYTANLYGYCFSALSQV